MEAEAGVAAVATREETPAMMEVATTRVAEATAAGASTMTMATAVVASRTDVRTQLAEARGIKSPRTVLRHHLPVRAEAAAVAGSQDHPLPMAEKSETHDIG